MQRVRQLRVHFSCLPFCVLVLVLSDFCSCFCSSCSWYLLFLFLFSITFIYLCFLLLVLGLAVIVVMAVNLRQRRHDADLVSVGEWREASVKLFCSFPFHEPRCRQEFDGTKQQLREVLVHHTQISSTS